MLDCQVKNGIAWLTLQRPAVLNAQNRAMVGMLADRIEELKTRSDVRVVVTQGAGRSFCAGSDLHELAPLSAREAAAYELHFAKVFSALDSLPQPTIAVLHGHVLGGGIGLALYHDFRIASETASLGMPEVELGWTPPWCVGRLAEIVGFSKARWLLMTCIPITGAEAASIGLVNEAVPEGQLQQHAAQLAERLAAMPAEGLRQTKMLLNRMSGLRGFEWDQAASESFEICYEKPEAQQRLRDFVARKKKR